MQGWVMRVSEVNTPQQLATPRNPRSRGLILLKKMHFKILKTTAVSGCLTALECIKFVFGRGSAPDFAGGSHSAPPNPVAALTF